MQAFTITFAGLWFYVWIFNTLLPLHYNLPSIMMKYTQPLKARQLRVSYGGQGLDYLDILRACDTIAGREQTISIILPKEPPRRFLSQRDKGRYYLYPKNYGMNDALTDYILVYGVKNYEIPAGYQVRSRFAKNKFLIERLADKGRK